MHLCHLMVSGAAKACGHPHSTLTVSAGAASLCDAASPRSRRLRVVRATATVAGSAPLLPARRTVLGAPCVVHQSSHHMGCIQHLCTSGRSGVAKSYLRSSNALVDLLQHHSANVLPILGLELPQRHVPDLRPLLACLWTLRGSCRSGSGGCIASKTPKYLLGQLYKLHSKLVHEGPALCVCLVQQRLRSLLDCTTTCSMRQGPLDDRQQDRPSVSVFTLLLKFLQELGQLCVDRLCALLLFVIPFEDFILLNGRKHLCLPSPRHICLACCGVCGSLSRETGLLNASFVFESNARLWVWRIGSRLSQALIATATFASQCRLVPQSKDTRCLYLFGVDNLMRRCVLVMADTMQKGFNMMNRLALRSHHVTIYSAIYKSS